MSGSGHEILEAGRHFRDRLPGLLGNPVEFFKDEATRRCRNCRQTVLNPRMDFGCAAYCKYAAQCLGEVGPELASQRDDLMKDRVALEVKRRLGHDFRRIGHGAKVARFAEEIGREEKAALAVVLCAAFLHLFFEKGDAGSPKAAEGEQAAREVLEGLGASADLAEKVMDLIASFFEGRRAESVDAMVFSDAHLLASLEGNSGRNEAVVRGLEADFRGKLLTAAGRSRYGISR